MKDLNILHWACIWSCLTVLIAGLFIGPLATGVFFIISVVVIQLLISIKASIVFVDEDDNKTIGIYSFVVSVELVLFFIYYFI